MFFINIVSSKSLIFHVNEFFAITAVVSWAVVLNNIGNSAMSFNLSSLHVDHFWSYPLVNSLTDWNVS